MKEELAQHSETSMMEAFSKAEIALSLKDMQQKNEELKAEVETIQHERESAHTSVMETEDFMVAAENLRNSVFETTIEKLKEESSTLRNEKEAIT